MRKVQTIWRRNIEAEFRFHVEESELREAAQRFVAQCQEEKPKTYTKADTRRLMGGNKPIKRKADVFGVNYKFGEDED